MIEDYDHPHQKSQCLLIEKHNRHQNHPYLQVSFNLAMLACIRQDKADVLEALIPQVENINNPTTHIAITKIIMTTISTNIINAVFREPSQS